MQPRVLTLPDSIRDRLEAGVASKPPRGIHRNEHLLHEVLFPLHPDPSERAFLREFQDAFVGMQNGASCPAVALRNLPEHHSKQLTDGLLRLLGNGRRRWALPMVMGDDRAQLLHHDYHFKKSSQHKTLTLFHYLSPGACRQPTIFATADDVIDAWAERIQKRTGSDLTECREQLIETLLKPHNPTGAEPAIARNPNYTRGSDAPEFILLATFTNPVGYTGENKTEATLTELDDVLRELEVRESKTCTVGTEANTIVMFNQGMVLHGRGYPEKPGQQEGRALRFYDTYSRVGHRDDAVSHVTATPTSKIHSIRLFGTTLAQWHQR